METPAGSAGEDEEGIFVLSEDHFDKEIDLIATTTEKWSKNINKIGYIYKQINSEGIVIYGK